MSIDGSVCFFVLYHYELNAILVKPIANVDNRSIYEAYKEVFETLEAKGYTPKINVMDNQATKYIKKFLTKKECELQVVEPHNHRVNTAEWAKQTFKDAFIATLMHLLRPSQQPIVTSHSNYGINWQRKSKTHSTYSGHRASTRIYPHTKLSTGLTIGIGTPWPHRVAKQ